MKNTLLLIFAALTLMIGTFVWFVTTWDASAEQPISFAPTPHSFGPQKLPPEGPLTPRALFFEKGTL